PHAGPATPRTNATPASTAHVLRIPTLLCPVARSDPVCGICRYLRTFRQATRGPTRNGPSPSPAACWSSVCWGSRAQRPGLRQPAPHGAAPTGVVRELGRGAGSRSYTSAMRLGASPYGSDRASALAFADDLVA